jgi:hypothetical protein
VIAKPADALIVDKDLQALVVPAVVPRMRAPRAQRLIARPLEAAVKMRTNFVKNIFRR